MSDDESRTYGIYDRRGDLRGWGDGPNRRSALADYFKHKWRDALVDVVGDRALQVDTRRRDPEEPNVSEYTATLEDEALDEVESVTVHFEGGLR